MATKTQDINVQKIIPLPTPFELRDTWPLTTHALQNVEYARQAVQNILAGTDPRLLVVIGPCSIRNYEETLEYAMWFKKITPLFPRFLLAMRVCPDKPRTTIGWPGFSDDPTMDGSHNVTEGLRETRRIFAAIADLGVPIATEVFGPFTVRYISDAVSYGWIGARSVADSNHRKLASALSFPIGFKNTAEGSIAIAVDAVATARHPHSFKGMNDDGRLSQVWGAGNQWGHIILRGGVVPNYDAASIAVTQKLLEKIGGISALVVDCAHSNSGKDAHKQVDVAQAVVAHRSVDRIAIVKGLMLESDLQTGRQNIAPGTTYQRGVSVTDACLGIAETELLLSRLHAAYTIGG